VFWSLIAGNAPQFFLVFARIFAMVSVAPLLSSTAVPGVARAAFTLLCTVVVFPTMVPAAMPPDSLSYILLLIGEILIGLIFGFIIQLVYASFQTAGQLFSMQMGFSASMVFDPISQEEVPVLGQFFNLGSMYLFITSQGLQKLFLGGVEHSFRGISAAGFATHREDFLSYFISSIGMLLQQAFMLAIPIIGVLFLVSLTMGLLAKAAPQMNLLMMGFPISISVALVMIFVVMPFLLEGFMAFVDNAFRVASELMSPGGLK